MRWAGCYRDYAMFTDGVTGDFLENEAVIFCFRIISFLQFVVCKQSKFVVSESEKKEAFSDETCYVQSTNRCS